MLLTPSSTSWSASILADCLRVVTQTFLCKRSASLVTLPLTRHGCCSCPFAINMEHRALIGVAFGSQGSRHARPAPRVEQQPPLLTIITAQFPQQNSKCLLEGPLAQGAQIIATASRARDPGLQGYGKTSGSHGHPPIGYLCWWVPINYHPAVAGKEGKTRR